MKSWPLLAAAVSILCLGIWFSFSDRETATDQTRGEFEKPAELNSRNQAPNIKLRPEDASSSIPAPAGNPVTATLQSETEQPSAAERMQAQAAETDQPLQQANALLAQASQELKFEAGLSAYNLMLLKDLATRLNELPSADQALLQSTTSEWPAPLRDTLSRLSAALLAETELQKTWQERAGQNPEGFREAWLAQQSQILGPDLYGKLYAEDKMLVDEAGLSGHYASEDEAPLLKAEAHQEKLKLLAQWRQDKLSETELKEALADSLSSEEINQLIDTGLNETAWLNQLDTFLEEYHYIEQSGIVGEDEAFMRKELLEKHFPPENRAIVNQFLFGAQAKP